jgi:predicted nucleotidyltransferase component of viral defense system
VISDVAHSIHQRLLNLAREQGRPFQELLQHYTLERFLYRLGQSPYADRFVLKGALMFRVWEGPLSRPTRDIDLLGRLQHSVENLVDVVRTLCDQEVAQDDGLVFHRDSVQGEAIVEAAEYSGVRVRLLATLGRARVPLHVDVGFGDAVVPGPVPIHLPTLLDFPPPVLQGYSRESAIAEKLQAMVYLGEINSRMKDFYDIWVLASRFAFEGATLADALRATFERRATALPAAPLALSETFAVRRDKQRQWRAFIRRQIPEEAVPSFEEVVAGLRRFLLPVIDRLAVGEAFEGRWAPGGPWER